MTLAHVLIITCDAPDCANRGPVTSDPAILRQRARELGWSYARRPADWPRTWHPAARRVDACPACTERLRLTSE